MSDQVKIQYNGDGTYYCVPQVVRECGMWLSVAKRDLPVARALRRPAAHGAVVMRGRDYYREFTRLAFANGRVEVVDADHELVADWRDAAWWTPGLQESWQELEARPSAAAAQRAKRVTKD
ncbi:MAG TPA: hypothetical protein VFB15_11545 [Candidatus Binataceae bacterium]|jgi:hypothetical protein|nr:hypothetical protein [Candidatus Binataceae bacterium]